MPCLATEVGFGPEEDCRRAGAAPHPPRLVGLLGTARAACGAPDLRDRQDPAEPLGDGRGAARPDRRDGCGHGGLPARPRGRAPGLRAGLRPARTPAGDRLRLPPPDRRQPRLRRGAATGALLLILTVPTAARSQPIPRSAQPDVPSPIARSLPSPYRTIRDFRSPTVEREHLRAQRIINRICSGC